MKKPNYGNWIPKTLMYCLWGGTSAFVALCSFSPLYGIFRCLRASFFFRPFSLLPCPSICSSCRHAFSFDGGGIMADIHKALLSHLSWDGRGSLIDIGCGSGALAILCGKTWPGANITGIDYWSREWNYAKEQCEENAHIEALSHITFCQGDAASLPFAD